MLLHSVSSCCKDLHKKKTDFLLKKKEGSSFRDIRKLFEMLETANTVR